MKTKSLNKQIQLTLVAAFLLNILFSPVNIARGAAFSESAQTTVNIGGAPSLCPQGWPSSGRISQGPLGQTSHGDPPVQIGTGGLEAVDIATDVGTQVYTTVAGIVRSTTGSGFDQRIGIQPNCPGLSIVYFWHLSAINVSENQTVTYGQLVGRSGAAGSGPHMHYQFNDAFNRSYSISDPSHVPTAVPRTCDSIAACNITINSAP